MRLLGTLRSLGRPERWREGWRLGWVSGGQGARALRGFYARHLRGLLWKGPGNETTVQAFVQVATVALAILLCWVLVLVRSSLGTATDLLGIDPALFDMPSMYEHIVIAMDAALSFRRALEEVGGMEAVGAHWVEAELTASLLEGMSPLHPMGWCLRTLDNPVTCVALSMPAWLVAMLAGGMLAVTYLRSLFSLPLIAAGVILGAAETHDSTRAAYTGWLQAIWTGLFQTQADAASPTGATTVWREHLPLARPKPAVPSDASPVDIQVRQLIEVFAANSPSRASEPEFALRGPGTSGLWFSTHARPSAAWVAGDDPTAAVGVLLFCFNTRCAYLPVRADTMLPGEPSYHWRAHDGIRLIDTDSLVGEPRLWTGPTKTLQPLR